MLAEASPRDLDWGIGLTREQAVVGKEWRGLNRLGSVLQRVRRQVRCQMYRWQRYWTGTGSSKWRWKITKRDFELPPNTATSTEPPMRWSSSNQSQYMAHLKGQHSSRLHSVHRQMIDRMDGWKVDRGTAQVAPVCSQCECYGMDCGGGVSVRGESCGRESCGSEGRNEYKIQAIASDGVAAVAAKPEEIRSVMETELRAKEADEELVYLKSVKRVEAATDIQSVMRGCKSKLIKRTDATVSEVCNEKVNPLDTGVELFVRMSVMSHNTGTTTNQHQRRRNIFGSRLR